MQYIPTGVESGDSSPKRPRLLLVDDQKIQLLAYGMAIQLQLPDYDVVMALGPQRALEEVRRTPRGFAGIISEVQMPGMNGPDLLASSVIYSWGEHHDYGLFRLLVSSSAEYPSPGFRKPVPLSELASHLGVYFMLRSQASPRPFAYAVHELLEKHQQAQHGSGQARVEIVDGHLVPYELSDLF